MRELGRLGRDDDARLAVADDLERTARVDGRHDRLRREERLVGDHAEVLVDGRVVHGEAARVEVGERVAVDAAGELDLAVQSGGEPLEPRAVRAVADDHDLQRRLGLRRVDQQVDPLGAIEPVDREDEAVVLGGAVGELLRRRRQDGRRRTPSTASAARRRCPRS